MHLLLKDYFPVVVLNSYNKNLERTHRTMFFETSVTWLLFYPEYCI